VSGPGVVFDGRIGSEAVVHLFRELPELFGDSSRTELLEVGPGLGPAHRTIRLGQWLDGARVRGGDLLAHFDAAGRLISLASPRRAGAATVNRRLISSEDASRIAREALSLAEPDVRTIGTPSTEAWIWPEESGLTHEWIVRQAASDPPALFATRIDAESGAVLDRWDISDKALRVGRALVYKTNADYPESARMAKLRDLSGTAKNPLGKLLGTRFDIVDEKGNDVRSPTLDFEFGPYTAADSFDQTSAYYQFELASRRWTSDLGVRGGPWSRGGAPVPVQVNAVTFCGAYYSPDLSGDGRPGFAFSDQNTCGSSNPDFTRDSDVIYHEFTHGILDWNGIDIALAQPNSYQRAISEADADYHAANFTGDPVIGEVVGFTRDLNNVKCYPADVPCDGYGFMEEHCTGEIWSGFLWDLQSAIGKGAERLELASLDYLVDNWPEGHVRDVIDFWDATLALLQADRDLNGGKYGGFIYGAAASRGFFGPLAHADDQISIIYEKLGRETKFRSIGWVYGPTQRVPYFFTAPAGADVTVRVRSTSSLQPSLLLSEVGAQSRHTIASPVTVGGSEAMLRAALTSGSALYVLEVFPTEATSGSFQLSIVVH
jgi:hypothetical protein